MSSPLAFAWVLPALVLFALLPTVGSPGEQDGVSLDHSQLVKKDAKAAKAKAKLTKLKKQADASSTKLKSATERYENNKSKVKLAKARLARTRVTAARTDQVYEKYRNRVGSFAASVYQSPLPDQNSVLLTSSNGDKAIQKATSLNAMTKTEETAVTRAGAEKHRADALNRQANHLATSTNKQQSKLAAQVGKLKKTSEASTKELTKLLSRLNGGAASRDASRTVLDASCGKKGKGDFKSASFSNGLLPGWAKCDLPGYKGEKLRADAARGFVEANAAYTQKFGKKMCITDAYRSLSEQQSVYSRKPGLAAVPGKSNHGWGLALDLGCGINKFGSPQHEWLAKHGPKYGWVHPSWAKCCPSEAWHFEYKPGTG